ncbi:retrovirus-related pol polyprotein from transposon TNT 1-94 [Tanacetum coccineum]|uniref:Retrovirus-related pol polyprotein from transposon TNT 1-94 n=1 Tax=Tanacetum coccineum TaxID=301880 RepID=A0ABQ5GWG5_9ASTR
MLEKGNYIPWKVDSEGFWRNSLKKGKGCGIRYKHGPYQRPLVPNPDNPEDQILEPLSKMTGVLKRNLMIEQMLLAMKDEAGSHLSNKENDFMLDNVMFDELTAMASECNNLEPRINCMNFNNSSEDSQLKPLKSDLDNLFGPLYEEYYEMSSQEVYDDPCNTMIMTKLLKSSLMSVDQDDAPPVVSSSDEQVSTAPNFPVMNEVADEFVQEDVVDFDGYMFHNANHKTPDSKLMEVIFKSQIHQIMHQISPTKSSTDRWDKIINRKNNQTKEYQKGSYPDPDNIPLPLLNYAKDELNQFKRLDVWELVECPVSRNIIVDTVKRREDFEESFAPVARLEAVHQSPWGIFICQSQYTMDIIKKHGMEKCDTVSTPTATTKLDAVDQTLPIGHLHVRVIKHARLINTSKRAKGSFDILEKSLTWGLCLDVFLHSHEKCVTRNALTRKSSVKRALFTSPVAAKSKGLGATSVVAKSRFSVAKTPTATNKVSSVSPLSQKSSQSRILSSYMNNKKATSKKWQKWFEYQQGFNWTPKRKTEQSQSNVHKSRTSVKSKSKTPVTTHKWVAKPSTPPSVFVSCLGHNLFSVGQFYDGDLEVAFRSNTCYVRNLEGDDFLTGSRDSNLYTISISEMAASSLVCLMSRATSTKSWLWNRRLSHLNFGTINQLTSHDLVDGLPKFKYNKNHLCSACEQGKSKKASLPPKLIPSTKSKLELLHMDFCGPMRVVSIKGKKYILVVVDDYSRYTWVYFLRTKDEAPDMIIDFVNQVQRNLKTLILTIRTDNGTEFKNEKLRAFYAKLGIEEYYATRSQEVFDNSAANTLDNDHTSASSSIVVEQDDAPQIVSSSEEQVDTEPNSPVLTEVADEFIQEDVADSNGNMFHNAPQTLEFDVAESSSTY